MIVFMGVAFLKGNETDEIEKSGLNRIHHHTNDRSNKKDHEDVEIEVCT